MSEQLTLLTQTGAPAVWACPTCHGTRVRPVEPGQAPEKCRVCMGTGTVDYDPDDRSIPF